MYAKLHFLITLCLKIVNNVPKLLQEKKKIKNSHNFENCD